jgi:hypothetical protein
MSTAKKKPAPVPLALALREAHDWCESAIFQGARLTELLDNQVAFDHANAMAAEWRALRAANVLKGGARVEVIESYFFLSSIRHLLGWLGHLTRHKNRPTKETVQAVKEFAASVPRATELRRVLEHEYTIGGWDLPELNLQSPEGGMALKAARGREYRMAANVSLQGAMAALAKLCPVLAAARPKPEPQPTAAG